MVHLEKKQNKCVNRVFILIVVLLLFASCNSESYIDLLTGDRIRFWQSSSKDFYISFDKKSKRILFYDENLKPIYSNGLDLLSKGQRFKIVGNRIITSWKVEGYTIPADTFDILEINNQRMVFQWTHGHPVTYNVYIGNETK